MHARFESVIIRAPFIDSKNPSFIAVLVFDRMRGYLHILGAIILDILSSFVYG